MSGEQNVCTQVEMVREYWQTQLDSAIVARAETERENTELRLCLDMIAEVLRGHSCIIRDQKLGMDPDIETALRIAETKHSLPLGYGGESGACR